ncbi:MAG: NAD-dependent protein deacylase [Clostridia bacterium]|nr:NAD-dependent protein deacylase [Clostridia bacterium]
MNEKINQLKEIIEKSDNIVFFGGAGVSTESGIPDFRSKDGLYNQVYKYPPEQILSHTFFLNKTEEFYDFYRDKLNSLKYEPNITHKKLAELEKAGKLKAVITQNIDGLHQKAGSKNVYELHGSVLRNYCMKCHKFYDAKYVFESTGIPKCECGGIIKPDVVLYEEGLNDEIINNSVRSIQEADFMIVAGTSLTVQPASGLINFFKGRNLVLINRDATPYDRIANLVINESLGDVFKEIIV